MHAVEEWIESTYLYNITVFYVQWTTYVKMYIGIFADGTFVSYHHPTEWMQGTV